MEASRKGYAKLLTALALVSLLAYAVCTWQAWHQYAGVLLMIFFLSVALIFNTREHLRGYAYTIMILAAVSLAMYYPQYFKQIGDFKFSTLIVPLLQLIMFGMGAALHWRDFARVLQMPKGVVIGIVCQFTIMPLLGFSLTRIFTLPTEVAAGVILVGCCPSGLASNVMSYLAKANLALSVTLTAVATLMAPVVTPALLELLAGEYVTIAFWDMMWDITKIIIVPIGAGLLFNHFLHGRFQVVDRMMPLVSMISIALIIVVIVSSGRDGLLAVGPVLIVITLLHNVGGYVLGYWMARFARMTEADCRTVAIEVGLQNGGLASGLALAMGKLATVGLAPALFGLVMNITGSSLALWWRSRGLNE